MEVAKMKEEIENNKHPVGCQIIHNYDRKEALRRLTQEKSQLDTQLECMPVSLYTKRAKLQRADIIDRLNEVEAAIKVYERRKVIVSL